MLPTFFKRSASRWQQALLDKQARQRYQPMLMYILAQIGLGLLFFVATLILYSGFKDALAELLLVLTDSQDEELMILNSYTQKSLHLFLTLFCVYLLCCVAITVNACKRRDCGNAS